MTLISREIRARARWGADAGYDQAASARPAKGRKRVDGQAEMLLPIAGKAKKAVEAKSTVRPSARQMKAG